MEKHVFQQYRERHGLSQAAFGGLLGVERSPQGRVSHWENRRQAVPIEYAYKFIAIANDAGEQFSLEDVFPPHVAA